MAQLRKQIWLKAKEIQRDNDWNCILLCCACFVRILQTEYEEKQKRRMLRNQRRYTHLNIVFYSLLVSCFLQSIRHMSPSVPSLWVQEQDSQDHWVDDVIVGLWVGGLLVSSSMWMYEWLKTKKTVKRVLKSGVVGVAVLMYALVLIPFEIFRHYWSSF